MAVSNNNRFSQHREEKCVSFIEKAPKPPQEQVESLYSGLAMPAQPAVTPTPVKQLTILGFILLSEAMNYSILLPYVGLYVAHLLNLNPNEAGYASGILIGLFLLGQVVSGEIWGHFSDKYGRKLPLFLSLLAASVVSFFFGLSPNIYVCCICRFLHGFLNGNALIAKTIITDITDSTNEAKGFAVMSLTWGVGMLIGPFVGGFLYDPFRNSALGWWKLEEDSFLISYPAFLPCLFLSLYTLLATGLCIFALEETNRNACSFVLIPRHKMQRYARRCVDIFHHYTEHWTCAKKLGTESSNAVVEAVCCEPNLAADGHHLNATEDTARWTTLLVSQGAENVRVGEAGEWEPTLAPPKLLHQAASGATQKQLKEYPIAKKLSLKQAIQSPLIRGVLILIIAIGIGDTAFDELLPLWIISSKEAGGLGLFSDDIGLIIASYSIPIVFANLFFSKICEHVKNKLMLYRICLLVLSLLTIAIPCSTYIGGNLGYWYVIVVGILRHIHLSWVFAFNAIFTSWSSPPGCVGAVFGLTQSVSCLARCAIPFITAPLFAWSISSTRKYRVFPFNHFLVFLLASIPTFMCIYTTYRLNFDSPKVIDGDTGGKENDSSGAGDRCCEKRNCHYDSYREHKCHSCDDSVYGSCQSHTSVMQDALLHGGMPTFSLNASFTHGAAIEVERIYSNDRRHLHQKKWMHVVCEDARVEMLSEEKLEF